MKISVVKHLDYTIGTIPFARISSHQNPIYATLDLHLKVIKLGNISRLCRTNKYHTSLGWITTHTWYMWAMMGRELCNLDTALYNLTLSLMSELQQWHLLVVDTYMCSHLTVAFAWDLEKRRVRCWGDLPTESIRRTCWRSLMERTELSLSIS